MAARGGSSSLRRRAGWLVGSVAAIAIVSLVAIVAYRNRDAEPKNVVAEKAVEAGNNGNDKNAAGDEGDNNSGANSGDPKNGDSKNNADNAAASNQQPGPKPAGDFHSPRYGYVLPLAGTPWKRWEDLSRDVPEAEWGAHLGDSAHVVVVPLSLGSLNPPQEALDFALLARLRIAYPSDALTDFAPLNHGDARGHAFTLRREVDGQEYLHRLWILRRGTCAYLVAAWSAQSAGGLNRAALDSVLEKFAFDDAPPIGPRTADFSPAQRQAHATLYNDLGFFTYQTRHFAAAAECFWQAFELQPNDPELLFNWIDTQIELKQLRPALAAAEQHIGRFPQHTRLGIARAFLLKELGETDAALAAYAALFAGGCREEGPFMQYAELLAASGREAEALAAVEAFLTRGDSFAVRRLQAGLLRQRGDHEAAIAILLALEQGRPLNADLAYDLADSYLAEDRSRDALDVCRRLEDAGYNTATMYVLKGKAEYALRWYAEARTSCEAALKREPANQPAQELLALVAAMLGEGNNAAILEAIEPVPLPQSLADERLASPDEAALKPYGAYFARRSVAIAFSPGEEFRLTDRRVIRVLDTSGVVRFSTIQVPLDPVSERLYVNSLRVLDAKGEEVAAGKPADYYVIDGGRNDAATHAKTLNIPVPGLQAGRTIELTFTRRDVQPPREFPYTAHTFSSDVPVLAAALVMWGEEKWVKWWASPGVQFARVEKEEIDDGAKPASGGVAGAGAAAAKPRSAALVWTIHEPLVYRNETLAAPRETFLPRVVIASASASWEALAKEYLASITDRLAPDEAAKRQADGLLSELATSGQAAADDAAKARRIAALVRYVQDHCTYKAIEFGRRAHVPQPADITLKNKYGDCKDHALLLVQLLRAAGYEAHLALANLDAAVQQDYAALEQFNHMLVYVPEFRGGAFFDCTDKDSDLLSMTAPLDLGGSSVLVLDADKPRFIELPKPGPDSSRIDVNRTVKLVGDADVRVSETVTVTGHHAAFLRQLFKNVPPANRAAVLQEELSPHGGAMQVESLEIKHLAERDKPLEFVATYLVRNRFQPAGEGWLGQLPALWERMYLGVQHVPQRRTPFEIVYPLKFSSTIELEIPPGRVAEPLAGMQGQNQTPFVSWKLSSEQTAERVKLRYELHLPAGTYPAADYAAYEADLEQAVAALAQNVVLKKAQ